MSQSDYHKREVKSEPTVRQMVSAGLATAGLFGVGFLMSRYTVCRPNQYIVKTGLGISNMSVHKKTIVYPFQKCTMVEMNPLNFPIKLNCMTEGFAPFYLPIKIIPMP